MAPVGAIIVAEHWLFPKMGLTRYWSKYKGNFTNYAAVITWFASLGLSYALETSGTLHLFFILIPIWLFATITYTGLAIMMGAKETYADAEEAESKETARKEVEQSYLARSSEHRQAHQITLPGPAKAAKLVSRLSLAVCAILAIMAYANSDIETIRSWLIVPTLIYFVTATYAHLVRQDVVESNADNNEVVTESA